MSQRAKDIVNEITNYVNSMSRDKEFCNIMATEHRTLQQSFTKLCFEWIEHVAKEDYRTDGRNEKSKEMAQRVLNLFKDQMKAEGWTGETLELMSKPSGHLPCI